jgi:DNA-binding NarL/FixJ family response regulator
MSAPTRLVIVDDHTLFRNGLRELLSHAPDLTVVGEGSSGPEAVALAEQLRPDVLLLDVEMPGPGAAETVEQLQRVAPDTRIVVLTMHEDPALVHELLSRGASAYLNKTIGIQELGSAVRAVDRSSGTVLLSVRRDTFAGIDGHAVKPLLSPRELDVLRLVAQARSNMQIAGELFISEGTVKRHLTNIYAKLGAVSRVDAIRKATAARLIRPDTPH